MLAAYQPSYVCLERELGAGRVGGLGSSRPFATLHINEPSPARARVRQSGTAQEGAQLCGTELTTGSFHFSPAPHSVGTTAEFGGEQKGTGEELQVF